jgi:hypothetical protein
LTRETHHVHYSYLQSRRNTAVYVRGRPTTTATYHGAATGLGDVWMAVEAAIEGVVDYRTLSELSRQSGRTEASTSSTT